MKVIRKGQGDPYEAPKHFNCWAMNKLRPDLSQRLQVGVSHFLPNGGAEMSSSPMERAYYVLSGSILVKGKNNEEHALGLDDLIYIAANEERSFQNQGTTPATILVIIVQLD